MTPPEPDLEHLTAELGRCLGRIDEHAFRLQHDDDDGPVFLLADLLDHEAATLQELLDVVLTATTAPATADVNRVVTDVATRLLPELGVPILSRQQLARELPPAGCAPALLTTALQRAMLLATDRLGPGGELTVVTRSEQGHALIELSAHGAEPDPELSVRAATLCEFVDGFGGICRAGCDQQGGTHLVLELPLAVVDRVR